MWRPLDPLRSLLIAGALALTATGCVTPSPTVEFYTLDMRPAVEGGRDPALVVDHIRVIEALARNDIMILKSPTEVEYYAYSQWASNLSELVKEKLNIEFGNAVQREADFALQGILLAFEQVDVLPATDDRPAQVEAHVKLSVTIRPTDARRYETTPFEAIYECREPAEAGEPAVVAAALTRCVESIAADIAEDCKTMEAARALSE